MIDQGTALAVGGFCVGVGQDVASRVLGLTADHYGEMLKNWVLKGQENVGKIILKADKKLPKEKYQKGSVPSRVFKEIFSEGAFCEDEVVQEYYAGVLASSKSEEEMDDRGVSVCKLISSLSNFQIRSHYLMYGIASVEYKEAYSTDRTSLMSIKIKRLCNYLGLQESEKSQAILEHVFFGLKKYDLIKPGPFISSEFRFEFATQYSYSPTPSGIELFLWANGFGDKPVDYFFSKDFHPHEIDICFKDFVEGTSQ